MSDPKTPKTAEEKTVPVTDNKNAPKNTSADEKEKSAETKDIVKDNGKQEQKRNLLVSVSVAIIIILAAACAFVFLTPQVATKGDIVSVYYTGAFDNGTVFDSNMNSTNPVVFTLGNSSVVPGFEEAVTGMSVNQVKTVTLPPEKAYGAYNSTLIQTVNRTGPIANTTFVEGQIYYIHNKATNTYSKITVTNVTLKTVTIDANNPLAGQNLTFTIKLDNITKRQ